MSGVEDRKDVVVAGFFENDDDVRCSDPTVDLTNLRSSQEEADTRVVLHTYYSDSSTIVC